MTTINELQLELATATPALRDDIERALKIPRFTSATHALVCIEDAHRHLAAAIACLESGVKLATHAGDLDLAGALEVQLARLRKAVD